MGIVRQDSNAATSPFDAIRSVDEHGENWSGRDLQPTLGYSVWRDFTNAIERAKLACANSGHQVEHHFADARKVIPGGRWGEHEVADYRLTRYAAYLAALNGDPRKDEIAAAQTYFAVKTREAEVAQPAAREVSRRELAQMVIDAEDRAELEAAARQVAEAKVAELGPAAESWNTLATAQGDYLVADAAKILSRDPSIKLGRDRLFTYLHERRWIYRQGSDNRWRAMQTAVDSEWLTEMAAYHDHPRTGERIVDAPQVRVTVKGLGRLHRILGGSAPLALGSGQLELEAATR